MDTASIHHAFAVEELQIRGDEDAVFFKGAAADVFAVLQVSDLTVDVLFSEHFSKLIEVTIHDKSVSLPHRGSQIVVGNEL